MNNVIILTLILIILLLSAAMVYQHISYTRGIGQDLEQISRTLSHILDTGSDEKVMQFTSDPQLQQLLASINDLLLDRQRIHTEFMREKIASRKMLSNISHDIKTPLTVILGYLEILRLQNPGEEMLQKVEARVLQVMDMINEFFTLAKLEAGDTPLSLCQVNICQICKESILSFYEILQQDDFTVEVDIPEKALYAYGDTSGVIRILSNLITNAIRYGREGHYLGLTLRRDSQFTYIDITDNGQGIEQSHAEEVFTRLFTMEDSRNRSIQGNGLGLTIARTLALQMGGDLLLSSRPYVKTVFTLKLLNHSSDSCSERKS